MTLENYTWFMAGNGLWAIVTLFITITIRKMRERDARWAEEDARLLQEWKRLRGG